MLIREINKEELNNYLSKIPHSLYQTEEYAKTMEKQNFNIKILGLEENGNIIGSTILLILPFISFIILGFNLIATIPFFLQYFFISLVNLFKRRLLL